MTRALAALVVVGAVAGGACGRSDAPAIPLDPLPSDDTVAVTSMPSMPTTMAPPADSAPPTTSADGASVIAGDRWVDATANLAGMESWCGNLAFVSARPDTDEVLASVAGQGWFVSAPGSTEWAPFARGEDSAPLDHRTSSVVYDPDEPDRFWESGFFGLGAPPIARAADVNRTDDGGATFVRLGESAPADLVSVDFGDPERQTLVIGVHGQPRALRSSDGGSTWIEISDGLPGDVGDASFPYVLDGLTYLLGSHKGSESGVFRTVDGGATWERVFDLAVSGPPLASTDGALYWVLDQGGVIKSADAGVSWEQLPNRAVAGGERRGRIVELDDGTWITLGADTVLVSGDRGATWQAAGPPLPYQPTGFTYAPIRKAVYIWQNYCEVDDDPDPVLAGAIQRLDLDVGA